jgi:hypothetical protein
MLIINWRFWQFYRALLLLTLQATLLLLTLSFFIENKSDSIGFKHRNSNYAPLSYNPVGVEEADVSETLTFY